LVLEAVLVVLVEQVVLQILLQMGVLMVVAVQVGVVMLLQVQQVQQQQPTYRMLLEQVVAVADSVVAMAQVVQQVFGWVAEEMVLLEQEVHQVVEAVVVEQQIEQRHNV
jgi:hypothetical protein